MASQTVTDQRLWLTTPRVPVAPVAVGPRRFFAAQGVIRYAGSVRRLLGQAVRYGLVGLSGLVVALVVLNAVMVLVRAFLLANVVAFVFAATWNFMLNRRLTFPATGRPLPRQWLEFLAGSLAAAALNWAVAGTLYYQSEFFHSHYNAAALIGTAAAAGANFLWARLKVFRPTPHQPLAS